MALSSAKEVVRCIASGVNWGRRVEGEVGARSPRRETSRVEVGATSQLHQLQLQLQASQGPHSAASVNGSATVQGGALLQRLFLG